MLRRFWRPHIWEYRTPYARKCLECGKNENIYGEYGNSRSDRWEEILPLAHSPDKCHPLHFSLKPLVIGVCLVILYAVCQILLINYI